MKYWKTSQVLLKGPMKAILIHMKMLNKWEVIRSTIEKPSINSHVNSFLLKNSTFEAQKENQSKLSNINRPLIPKMFDSFSEIYIPSGQFGSTMVPKIHANKPFSSLINKRSNSIEKLNKLDSQIQEAQRHFNPCLRNISKYRK